MILPLILLAAATASAQVRLPQYHRQVLPNGVVLIVMPKADVPLVSIRVAVKGGLESDPAGTAGVASITAESLRRGTAKRTADEFSRELDALGATFRAGVDHQSTYVISESLAKDFEKGLDLVLDAITRPTFPESEMKKVFAQAIDEAKSIRDDPDSAARVYYTNFYFGSAHPYGQVADELALAKITRQTVVDYHKRMYAGRNMIVVIAGDVETSKAAATAAKAFGTIPAGQAYEWKKAEAPRPAETQVAIVDKPDATQTQVKIGMPGMDRRHPDRTALWLVNTLFGGRFTSILNDELRVNSGLTYGAGSQFDRTHLPGRITISTFTATENTGKTVDRAIELLRNLAKQGITAEQLASAKAYLKGTYPRQALETADQIAAILSEIELFALNRGEVDDLFSRIDAVTVEKANQVAKTYLGTDKLKILLLGNAAKIAPEVKKYDADPLTVSIGAPGLRVTH